MAAAASIVIMISGRGSNMAAIIKACENPKFNAVVTAVISDRCEAPGLALAQKSGVRAVAIARKDFPSRDGHEAAILAQINKARPNLICLAGFMRILSAGFIDKCDATILNIHPSLLPKYTGLNTHQRALDAGDNEHGCSVHIVTEKLDEGPLIAQARITIAPQDDANSLAAKVLKLEHGLYLEAIEKIVHERI